MQGRCCPIARCDNPDDTQVKAGEKLIKTWEFQNTGTCPWINYTVKSSGGDNINAPLSAPMPAALPKEKVQVSLELTAPAADGKYAGYFTLHNSNDEIVPIGLEKTFWVKFHCRRICNCPYCFRGQTRRHQVMETLAIAATVKMRIM